MGGYGHLIVLILCILSANSTKSGDPYQADQFQEPWYNLHCERILHCNIFHWQEMMYKSYKPEQISWLQDTGVNMDLMFNILWNNMHAP